MNSFLDNVILVDADGVFLNFDHSYTLWMYENGYGLPSGVNSFGEPSYDFTDEKRDLVWDMFKESAAISRLPPMRDAVKYIKKLHEEHGFVFHCITALPNIPSVYNARTKNIRNLFGKTAFERITLCDSPENKKQHLLKYKDSGCFWIEDLPQNAEMGRTLGLQSLLMNQPNNKSATLHEDITRVENWKEIYDIVIGN